MKNIDTIQKIKLENYDIEIKQYLTPIEIEQIVQAIVKFDNYSEREQNKLILVLYHSSGLSLEEIEKYSFEQYVNCGLIEEIKKNVINFNEINNALEYIYSPQKQLNDFIKENEPKLKVFAKNFKPIIKQFISETKNVK